LHKSLYEGGENHVFPISGVKKMFEDAYTVSAALVVPHYLERRLREVAYRTLGCKNLPKLVTAGWYRAQAFKGRAATTRTAQNPTSTFTIRASLSQVCVKVGEGK